MYKSDSSHPSASVSSIISSAKMEGIWEEVLKIYGEKKSGKSLSWKVED